MNVGFNSIHCPLFIPLLIQQIPSKLFPFIVITVHQDDKKGYDKGSDFKEFISGRNLRYIN